MPIPATHLADPLAILRHMARETRESRPGVLETLLLALLAALLGRPAPAARGQWHPSPDSGQRAGALGYESLRGDSGASNRLCAWIGWILRGLPNRGMAPSGARRTPLSPVHVARAPPRA